MKEISTRVVFVLVTFSDREGDATCAVDELIFELPKENGLEA